MITAPETVFAELGCVPEHVAGLAAWYHPESGLRFVFIPLGEHPEISEVPFHICIHEDVWNNRHFAVINRLRSVCGLNSRVHGRQCEIHRIDRAAASQFLEQFHIGGYVTAHYKYGLFHRNELMAVATFSKGRLLHREQEGLKSYELLRFATKPGISVAGGLDKLLQHFNRETGARHLMTYADQEWTDGKSYDRLGFQHAGTTPPLHFMVNRDTFERIPMNKWSDEMAGKWVEVRNKGNLKLIRRG